MSKTFNGYINYGCLAAEKRPLFTAGNPHATATTSVPVEYAIPDGWELFETESGDVRVEAPWGWNYNPNDLLDGKENPYFSGIDKEGKTFRKKLEWKEI